MKFKRLRSIHDFFKNKGTDRPIYLCTFLLCVFGVFMIGDASVGMAIARGNGYATINMIKQVLFLLVGAGAMIFIARMPTFSSRSFDRESRMITFLYGFVLVAMLACRLWQINGSHAWIKLGPITIQPSELMKIVMILYLSMALGRWTKVLDEKSRKRIRKKKMAGVSSARLAAIKKDEYNRKFRTCVVMPFAVATIACFTCGFYQSDMGSAIIMFGICFCVLLADADPYYRRLKKAFMIAIPAFCVVVLLLGETGILASHQLSRFAVWLDPTNRKYIYGAGYQVVNGLVGYTNGGLIGRGLGNSMMKYGYIPEAQNDYISAIITEEFGLFGMLLVLVPYIVIIFRLFEYSYRVPDREDKLTLVGVASYFFLHVIVNVGGVSGLIPMTGVPLLLVSAGGTSTIAALCAIGLAQGIISRYNHRVLQEEAEKEVA